MRAMRIFAASFLFTVATLMGFGMRGLSLTNAIPQK
jgi:hypothetical protein